MHFLKELTLIASMIAYCLVLGFSIYERRIQKKVATVVLSGLFIGFTVVGGLVGILAQLSHYDQFPLLVVTLLCAPIVEETTKLLFIYYLGFLLQGTLSKFQMIRLSGGLGLGFASIETLDYIIRGATYTTILERSLLTSPFHISSTLLIGIGLTEKKLLILFPMAIAFHSLSNFFALSNTLLQGTLVWIILPTFYIFSEIEHSLNLRARFSSLIKKWR